MSYTTNVPSITFDTTGLVLPEESDILSGVEADLNSAFGGNLSQSLSSPQGQLAQSLTAIIGSNNDTFAYIANQVDPSNASGSFQDAIGRIYFMTRIPATATVERSLRNPDLSGPLLLHLPLHLLQVQNSLSSLCKPRMLAFICARQPGFALCLTPPYMGRLRRQCRSAPV